MNSKKDLYYHLTRFGIFLTEKKLDEVYDYLKVNINKSILATLYTLEQDELLKKKFSNPDKGAYSSTSNDDDDNHKAKRKLIISKPVYKLSKMAGNLIREYHSVYAAAKDLGLSGSEAGNISQAASGKRKTAYGYRWSYSN